MMVIEIRISSFLSLYFTETKCFKFLHAMLYDTMFAIITYPTFPMGQFKVSVCAIHLRYRGPICTLLQ